MFVLGSVSCSCQKRGGARKTSGWTIYLTLKDQLIDHRKAFALRFFPEVENKGNTHGFPQTILMQRETEREREFSRKLNCNSLSFTSARPLVLSTYWRAVVTGRSQRGCEGLFFPFYQLFPEFPSHVWWCFSHVLLLWACMCVGAKLDYRFRIFWDSVSCPSSSKWWGMIIHTMIMGSSAPCSSCAFFPILMKHRVHLEHGEKKAHKMVDKMVPDLGRFSRMIYGVRRTSGVSAAVIDRIVWCECGGHQTWALGKSLN